MEDMPGRLQQGDDRPATPAQVRRVRLICERKGLEVPADLTTWDANEFIQRHKKRAPRE